MAEPRKNIAKLRGLSLGPPPKPEADSDPTPGTQPTSPQEPAPRASPSRPAADPPVPAVSAPAAPEPSSSSPASDGSARSTDSPTPRRRATQRRASQTRVAEGNVNRASAPRRSQATTVYLPRDTRDRLDQARNRTGASNIDLILEAIHATWRDVAAALKTPDPKADPDLDLPLPRRPRRTVAEASTLQLRLTPAEHAGITNLAHQANVSISELVTRCIDRHWPE